jgi:hypothetical protein
MVNFQPKVARHTIAVVTTVPSGDIILLTVPVYKVALEVGVITIQSTTIYTQCQREV